MLAAPPCHDTEPVRLFIGWIGSVFLLILHNIALMLLLVLPLVAGVTEFKRMNFVYFVLPPSKPFAIHYYFLTETILLI